MLKKHAGATSRKKIKRIQFNNNLTLHCITPIRIVTRADYEAPKVGINVEMPGPTVHRGDKLIAAVRDGAAQKNEIDKKMRRVLHLSVFARDHPDARKRVRNEPVTSQLICQASAECIVLLKNSSQLLPLKPNQQIAVVWLPAETLVITGGGRSTVTEEELVCPLEALRVYCFDLVYHPGVPIFKKLPSHLTRCPGSPLVSVDWFNGHDFDPRRHLKSEVIDPMENHVFDNVESQLEPQ